MHRSPPPQPTPSPARKPTPPSPPYDGFATVPGAELLPGLRGKDVVVVFVESYGRVAVEGSTFAPASATCSTGHRPCARAGPRERVPDLAHVRRDQLAGPRHLSLRPLGRHPAAPRPAARQRPVHPGRRVPPGRLADRRRRAVEPRPLGRGRAFYHFDVDYDRHDVGYGAQVQLRRHARPVHAVGVPASGAGSRITTR